MPSIVVVVVNWSVSEGWKNLISVMVLGLLTVNEKASSISPTFMVAFVVPIALAVKVTTYVVSEPSPFSIFVFTKVLLSNTNSGSAFAFSMVILTVLYVALSIYSVTGLFFASSSPSAFSIL